MEDERALIAGAESGGRPGDIDRSVVRWIELHDEEADPARPEARLGADDIHGSVDVGRHGGTVIICGATPGPFPQQRSVRVEFQEDCVVPVIHAQAGHVHQTVRAYPPPRAPEPPDRTPIPEPLSRDRPTRSEP